MSISSNWNKRCCQGALNSHNNIATLEEFLSSWWVTDDNWEIKNLNMHRNHPNCRLIVCLGDLSIVCWSSWSTDYWVQERVNWLLSTWDSCCLQCPHFACGKFCNHSDRCACHGPSRMPASWEFLDFWPHVKMYTSTYKINLHTIKVHNACSQCMHF